MIELSNSNALVLAANQAATFDTVLLKTGCAECHRQNSGAVNLTQKNAIYEVSYNCNMGASAEGTAEIGLMLDGSVLPETVAIVQTAAAGDVQNVAASTYIKTCCCNTASTLLLVNTGITEINIEANPRLSVKRLA